VPLFKPDNRHLQVKLPPALWRLRIQPSWLVWKWSNGKKPPINCHGVPIDGNDPDNWMTHADACALYQHLRIHKRIDGGLGFALTDSNIVVLDLDHCRGDGQVRTADWALALGRRTQSYSEISVSGEGIHILGLTDGPAPYNNKQLPRPNGGKLEILRKGYVTISGRQIWTDYRLRNIDDVIDELTSGEPTVAAAVGMVGTVEIEACGDDWCTIVQRRAFWLDYEVTRRVDEGWRSHIIWKIGRTLRDRRATPGEVAVVLAASRCFRDKWGNNAKALQGELTRIFTKPLRAPAPWPGRKGG